MLSLKATLKAIGEALDGKATKYTGYGTPVALTTSWYTIPSDGLIQIKIPASLKIFCYVKIRNGDGSNAVELNLSTPWLSGTGTASETNCIPVFKGQQATVTELPSGGTASFIPFI